MNEQELINQRERNAEQAVDFMESAVDSERRVSPPNEHIPLWIQINSHPEADTDIDQVTIMVCERETPEDAFLRVEIVKRGDPEVHVGITSDEDLMNRVLLRIYQERYQGHYNVAPQKRMEKVRIRRRGLFPG
jgi:hypothetical protein